MNNFNNPNNFIQGVFGQNPFSPNSPGRYNGGAWGGNVPTTIGPFRSYGQVVREFLSGYISHPAPAVAHEDAPRQSGLMVAHSRWLNEHTTDENKSDTTASYDSVAEGGRVLSRLDLAAADRSLGPNWQNVPMNMVTIVIQGEDGSIDGKPFYLHKAFFTHLSPYFDAAFNSGFAESETQTLHFTETTREIFAMLVDWVYTKDLKALATFELDDRKNLPLGVGLSTLQGRQLEEYIAASQETAFEYTTKLIDLWFLADKVLLPGLQNAALQAIELLRFFTPLQGVPADISRAVYDKTPKGSPIRMYLADTTLRRLHPKSEDQGEEFHPDMLADIFDFVKIAGADPRQRHYGLSERSMEFYFVEVKGDAHLKARPNVNAPLADDIWISLWELRRNALKLF